MLQGRIHLPFVLPKVEQDLLVLQAPGGSNNMCLEAGLLPELEAQTGSPAGFRLLGRLEDGGGRSVGVPDRNQQELTVDVVQLLEDHLRVVPVKDPSGVNYDEGCESDLSGAS